MCLVQQEQHSPWDLEGNCHNEPRGRDKDISIFQCDADDEEEDVVVRGGRPWSPFFVERGSKVVAFAFMQNIQRSHEC